MVLLYKQQKQQGSGTQQQTTKAQVNSWPAHGTMLDASGWLLVRRALLPWSAPHALFREQASDRCWPYDHMQLTHLQATTGRNNPVRQLAQQHAGHQQQQQQQSHLDERGKLQRGVEVVASQYRGHDDG